MFSYLFIVATANILLGFAMVAWLGWYQRRREDRQKWADLSATLSTLEAAGSSANMAAAAVTQAMAADVTAAITSSRVMAAATTATPDGKPLPAEPANIDI